MSHFNDYLKELFWKIINFCMSKNKRNLLQKYQYVSGYILPLNNMMYARTINMNFKI